MDTIQGLGGFVRPKQVCRLLSISRSTLWRLGRNPGGFPQPFRLSRRITVYRADEIQAWMDAQARGVPWRPGEPQGSSVPVVGPRRGEANPLAGQRAVASARPSACEPLISRRTRPGRILVSTRRARE